MKVLLSRKVTSVATVKYHLFHSREREKKTLSFKKRRWANFQRRTCCREKDCMSNLQSKIFRSVLPLSSVCCAPSTPEESLRGPWLRVCLQERMEMIGPYNTLSQKLVVVWRRGKLYLFLLEGSWKISFQREKRLFWASFCPTLALCTAARVKSFWLRWINCRCV